MGTIATERLDLVVLGATGFTGKHTVKNLVKIIKANNYNFSWGISGRSKEKIQNLLTDLEEIGEEKTKITVIECDIKRDDIRNVTRKAKVLINCTGPNTILSEPIVKACVDTKTHYVDISAELYHMLNLHRTFNESAEEANIVVIPACGFAVIPALTGLMYLEQHFKGEEKTKITVIECDIKRDDIRNVTRKAKVLINCTGPNTILSEPIVKACVDTKTHYVDISAELYHMLNLHRTFNESAEEANIVVIPACGFAVIPALTGLMYLEQHFKGTLNTVECYAEVIIPKRVYFPGLNKCILHYGTWESLVHELQNLKAYRILKAETFPQNIYDSDLPEIKRSFFHKDQGRLWFPYPGSDEDVVEMSQRYLHEKKGKRAYRCKIYTALPAWFHYMIIPTMFIYYYLCYLECFRHLLWKYPRFFTLGYVSHKGPTEKMAKDIKFAYTCKGNGMDENGKKKSLTVKVTGSDPAYETTSITVVIAALTILTEGSKMPKGGVLPVGAAFQDTQIVDNIMKNKGLTYEIIDNKIKEITCLPIE
ncbi:saccharopine dehydrogenase-like oxidoreductase [Ostrinia nubilalis]|uniref:saccharopine dehydrogenase-like oxidoreductase n=1 Tax=Ostrinia nubilalis TaxID=29057 RepID=UPI00308233BA